jgi:hypothetical protein
MLELIFLHDIGVEHPNDTIRCFWYDRAKAFLKDDLKQAFASANEALAISSGIQGVQS